MGTGLKAMCHITDYPWNDRTHTLESMKRVNGIKTYQNWNRKTSILLLSGENDPVGDFGKGVLQVKKSIQ